MASSNEDGEIVTECVTNYWFFDQSNIPTSFTCLPVRWLGDEVPGNLQTHIFLRGTGDDGLQEVCKQVIAWRFELSYALPEISVLSKHGKWVQLQNPRKSFEKLIRSTLITIYSLHYLKKNQEASGAQLWNYLRKTFGSYELEPSASDLVVHMSLIMEATRRDKDLANCKYLLSFVDEDIPKIKASYKDIQPVKKMKFIANDMVDINTDVDELDAEEEPSFDTVCAICDNGGKIVPCEGICMRSFHATTDSGGGFCESLGFISDAQVEAVPVFRCKNCKYRKHQCFACGRLGSSDMSCGAEVFSCFSGTCGHFYHPKCVAELLHPIDKAQAVEVEKKIIAGESFTCPIHKCIVCHQIEDKTVHDMQLAVCRRCPKAYHRKCLPREISFGGDGGSLIRAWNGLLPNRILIYCMDHTIDPKLGTPARDHIIFPPVDGKKKKKMAPIKLRLPAAGRSITSESWSTEKTAVKMLKSAEKTSDGSSIGDSRGARTDDVTLLRKRNTTDSMSAKRSSYINQLTSSNDGNSLVKNRTFSLQCNSSLNLRQDSSNKQQNVALPGLDVGVMGAGKQCSSEKNDIENRILTLMRDCNASFEDEYKAKHNAKSSHAMLDRSITMGKVEHYVKAIRTALQKLDGGSTIEEAKEICEPGILKQILIWRKKLRVYMAPFLHGARYTSFGRHFTKSDKLKEIVDRLQWYVQNGDTIVDFCCGANEFSFLLKEKLEKIGKRCFFKNYDLFPPQNAFSFEKRDWMSVDVKELPLGSKLIMGLNPPFGVKASLANKFIQKALEFKPKLLVLIVPDETDRLDSGAASYDLIWRDRKLLSGKSFYLPGSVDVHNQQLDDWNLQPPSLYLWSRRDWTSRHKALAEEYGHLVNNLEGVMDRNTPSPVVTTMHQTGDMIVDMEISSQPESSIGHIQEASQSLPMRQLWPVAPNPLVGELRHQGFQNIEQHHSILPHTPLIYSHYGYLQPPLPHEYPHYEQNFQFMSPTSFQTQSASPYDPFYNCWPATDPNFPK